MKWSKGIEDIVFKQKLYHLHGTSLEPRYCSSKDSDLRWYCVIYSVREKIDQYTSDQRVYYYVEFQDLQQEIKETFDRVKTLREAKVLAEKNWGAFKLACQSN